VVTLTGAEVFAVFSFSFSFSPVCAEVRAREREAARGGWGEADGRGRAAGRGVDAEGARAGGQARGAAEGRAGLQDEDLLWHGQSTALTGGFACSVPPWSLGSVLTGRK
jgi:hypothetical protein